MKSIILHFRILVSSLVVLTSQVLGAAPMGTAFTYNGLLTENGQRASGSYDLRFILYDADSGGNQVGAAFTNLNTTVSNGTFVALLDFGPAAFNGDARWLEIAVRTNGGGAFVPLNPRQPLTPAPYALHAANAGQVPASGITGMLASTQLSSNVALLNAHQTFSGTNRFAGIVLLTNVANRVAGQLGGDGASLSNLSANSLVGQLPDARLSGNIPRLNGEATFLGVVQFANPLDRFAGSFVGDGSGVLNVNLGALNSGGAISVSNFFTLSASPGVGTSPTSLAVADVSGDGWLDLISANFGSGVGHSLTVLTNNRHGGFTVSASPNVGNGPASVTVTDVNGDGWLDLVSANAGDGSGNTLSVLTNSGQGSFALWTSPRVGRMPLCVAAADVNGDGRMDLISTDEGDNQLTVLTNSGSGGFVTASTAGFATGPFWVEALDVNGDSRIDLVTSLSYVDQLVVLTNSGDGRFQQAAVLATGRYPRRIVAADVNGDGRLDLVSANANDDSLTVLTNSGRGTFGLATQISVGNPAAAPVAVQAADVNADGRLDLVSANSGDNTLTVLTNDGHGGFGLAHALGTGNGLSDVVAADLNGDGQPDLATANFSDNTLSVLLGSRQVSFVGNGSGLTGVTPGLSTVTSTQLVQDAASLSKISGGTMTSSGGNIGIGTASPSSKLEVMGTVTANAFVGGGAGLTNLNASHLASGRLPSACLTGTYSNPVTFDNASGSFAGNGAALTGLNASQLASGTVPDARLSTNVARLDADVVFSGVVTAGGDELQGNRLNIGVGNSFRILPGTPLRPGATIAGGTQNTNATDYGAIGGGQNNVIRELATHAHIGGGKNNDVRHGAEMAHIGGGDNNVIRELATHGHIGGGMQNELKARAVGACIGGGGKNVIEEDAGHAHIGGGISNRVDRGAENAHIGGGGNNTIAQNAPQAHIGGGKDNEVKSKARGTHIGGGEQNAVEEEAAHAHIGGGKKNVVRKQAEAAFIGGGASNDVASSLATLGGGWANVIQAQSPFSTVSGGSHNQVETNALAATIPGGSFNLVTASFSLAAGYRAQARHRGAFVWADSQDADFASTQTNQFAIRAQNGVLLQADTNGTALELATGGAIKVTGAGVGTATPVFIHRANATNISGHLTYLDHPHCNGQSNAILIVTHNYSQDTAKDPAEKLPVGVVYDSGQWAIGHEDHAADMPIGRAFNVLVVKP